MGDGEKELPPVTTLHVDVVGTRGKRYVGDFVFHVPTLNDQIEIGKAKTRRASQIGVSGDLNATVLVEQLGYLDVTIKKDDKTPPWWDPDKMYDATPVSTLYAQAVAYENRFHGADEKPGADREEASGEAEGQGDAVLEGRPSLGRKAPPSAQRSETLVAHTARGG